LNTGISINKSYSCAFARIETITSTKNFKPLLNLGQYCMIPVKGYYQWTNTPKDPYYVSYPNKCKIMHLAAIYKIDYSNQCKKYSFAIISLEMSDGRKFLGERMPALVRNDQRTYMMRCATPYERSQCSSYSTKEQLDAVKIGMEQISSFVIMF